MSKITKTMKTGLQLSVQKVMWAGTVVPVMNGHPRDQAKVSVHCRWPLIRGNLTLKCVGRGIDNMAIQGRWPLTTGVAQGRYYCTQCSDFFSQARLILCQYINNFAALCLNCVYVLNILISTARKSVIADMPLSAAYNQKMAAIRLILTAEYERLILGIF